MNKKILILFFYLFVLNFTKINTNNKFYNALNKTAEIFDKATIHTNNYISLGYNLSSSFLIPAIKLLSIGILFSIKLNVPNFLNRFNLFNFSTNLFKFNIFDILNFVNSVVSLYYITKNISNPELNTNDFIINKSYPLKLIYKAQFIYFLSKIFRKKFTAINFNEIAFLNFILFNIVLNKFNINEKINTFATNVNQNYNPIQNRINNQESLSQIHNDWRVLMNNFQIHPKDDILKEFFINNKSNYENDLNNIDCSKKNLTQYNYNSNIIYYRIEDLNENNDNYKLAIINNIYNYHDPIDKYLFNTLNTINDLPSNLEDNYKQTLAAHNITKENASIKIKKIIIENAIINELLSKILNEESKNLNASNQQTKAILLQHFTTQKEANEIVADENLIFKSANNRVLNIDENKHFYYIVP